MLRYEKKVVFNGREVVTYNFCEIQINDPSGDCYGEIQIPYSSIYRLSDVVAVITDFAGREVRKVKKKEMTDRSAISSISFYEDDFIREFKLKHNTYPYRIRYSYTITSKQFITLVRWIPAIDIDIPTRSATLDVTVPANTNIRCQLRGVSRPDTLTDGTDCTYTWTSSYEGKAGEELSAPPALALLPEVTVMPEHFYFDKPGSLSSWKSFGNWVCELNAGLDQLSPGEEARIERCISNTTDKREQLQLLYRRLQEETRYVNISIETGGFKPYPASYVAEKKYGDCKALTNYFQSVLKVAGLESYYTLVYLGENINPVDTNFVVPQFNHAILMVPLDGDTLWVDCTSKAPLNYVGPSLQNRKAFVVDRDNSRFLDIPPLRYQDVVQTRKVHFSRMMNGKVRGEFTTVYRGGEYQELHYYQRNYHRADNEYIIRKYFTARGFEPMGHEMSFPCDDSAYVVLNVEAVSPSFCKEYGSDLIFNVLPMNLPRFEKPGRRVNDVQLNCPVVLKDTLEYRLPPGCAFGSLPEQVSYDSDFGSYSLTSRVVGDHVEVIKEFTLFPGHVSLEEYDTFYDFVFACLSAEINKYIVFTKT